jgi:hypothetical protein
MLITCLVVSSLFILTVTFTAVHAASKPSVPQFSLTLIDNSYDVPPYSTTDSYTGVTITKSGYRVDNRSIEVTIKNQSFKSYTNADGYECNLYYNVQVKGHYGNDTEWYSFFYSCGLGAYGGDYRYGGFAQSDSSYTTVSSIITYPVGSLLDFRVEAFTGYWVPPTQVDHLMGMHSLKIVRDESSDYSSVQTVTLTSVSLSLSPSQTTIFPHVTSDGNSQPQSIDQTRSSDFIYIHPTDSIFANSFFMLGVGVALGVIIVTVVMLIFRRQQKTSTYASNSSQTNIYVEPSLKLFSLIQHVSEV